MKIPMKVVLAYKNFAANRNISHIGLGVAAMNTAKSLLRAGISAEVLPIQNVADLDARVVHGDVTHAVVSAPWIQSRDWQRLTTVRNEIQFAVNCHSNVGFLQADPNGMKLFGEGMEIERGTCNFRMAGNSRKFTGWAEATFGVPCAYLPNLYYLDEHLPMHRPIFSGGLLRVGAFGATRVLKNLMSAAGAALSISRDVDADLELWINSGRAEGGRETVSAIKELFAITRHGRVIEAGWQSWHNHRKIVSMMDLLLSPSYTESFNMVTADGIAEGVASVVSDAIDWAPEHWKARADDVLDIARVGRYLLHDPNTGRDGFRALSKHNSEGLFAWQEFLGSRFRNPCTSIL
jgi:hypothetical protein